MITHQYVEVNEIKLHIAKQGTGDKLVVLLHGWPEFWYTWRFQIPVLAAKYTVVAPDLRGFNLSDKPKGIKNYKTEIVASDIAALIPKLGFEKAYIVGHDWGGATAWTFATLYPQLTEKLVVLNCPHPVEMLKALKGGNRKQMMKSLYIFFFQIPWFPEFLLGRNLRLLFKKNILGWLYNKQNFTENDLNLFVEAFQHQGALTASLNYYRAAVQTLPDRRILKQKIKAQTLLIWGERDKALGKELTYDTAKYIDNTYEVKYISRCSHWTQNDCPDEVNKFLIEFLA